MTGVGRVGQFISLESAAHWVGAAAPATVGVALLVVGVVLLLRQRGRSAPHPATVPDPIRRRSRLAAPCIATGLLLALLGGNSLVGDLSLRPPETRTEIKTPPTAGGLERTELAPELVTLFEERKKRATAEGFELQSAGYTDGKLVVIFTGTESGSNRLNLDILNMFAGAAKASGVELGKLTEFPAGDRSGEVRCTTHRTNQVSQVQCGWLDRDTMGMLTATGTTESQLADLLLRMRPDLEQPWS